MGDLPTDDDPWHLCEPPHDDDRAAAWGPAIIRCIGGDDGSLWVDNLEYASRVRFCPFCGEPARAP